MSRLVQFFKTDAAYKQEVSRYKPADGILALAVFVLLMVLYYVMGVLQAGAGIYLGVPMNLFFIALCILLVIIRKDGLTSLGFKQKNAGKSALAGLALGAAAIAVNAAVGLGGGGALAPFGVIASKFFYFLIVIALSEEIVFRGYIQTRLFGLIRNNAAATIAAGVLFTLMHIPYQMGAAGLDLAAFCRENWWWFLTLMAWHLVFTYLYRRFNSILAPTVFHALMDWSNILFV